MKGVASVEDFPDLPPGQCSHETSVRLNEVREHLRVRVKVLRERLVLRRQHHDVAGGRQMDQCQSREVIQQAGRRHQPTETPVLPTAEAVAPDEEVLCRPVAQRPVEGEKEREEQDEGERGEGHRQFRAVGVPPHVAQVPSGAKRANSERCS